MASMPITLDGKGSSSGNSVLVVAITTATEAVQIVPPPHARKVTVLFVGASGEAAYTGVADVALGANKFPINADSWFEFVVAKDSPGRLAQPIYLQTATVPTTVHIIAED